MEDRPMAPHVTSRPSVRTLREVVDGDQEVNHERASADLAADVTPSRQGPGLHRGHAINAAISFDQQIRTFRRGSAVAI